MRILLWTEFFHPNVGGIERSAGMLMREMTERGYQFVVVTTRYNDVLPEESLWHGIPVYRISFATTLRQGDLPNWLRQQKRLLKLVDDFKPELYHVFGVGISVLAFLQIYRQRPLPLLIRLAVMSRTPDLDYQADSIVGKLLADATWVTAVSQALCDQTAEYVPAIASRISVLYNGHPLPDLQPTLLAEPPCILFLGRLVEQKGGDLAVAAFIELHKRYPAARLIVAGSGVERERLEAQAASLGDAVEFLGLLPPYQVHEVMNRATLVLIPSRWEGLPNVAIEAAYMARPVVATAIPGMAEVVVDGRSGILVEPGDVQGLTAAMAHLLDHPDQAVAMGQAARELMLARFTIARCADDYEALYPRVVALYKAALAAPQSLNGGQ